VEEVVEAEFVAEDEQAPPDDLESLRERMRLLEHIAELSMENLALRRAAEG
jgi:hypothetical protein